MSNNGRTREINEILTYIRAARVGNLLLGESDGNFPFLYHEEIEDWPRKKIRIERERVREYLKEEVKQFCRTNFPKLKPSRLAELYDPLFVTRGRLRMPMTEFLDFVGGEITHDVFRGAPLHSTVTISTTWGLQTEFPEQHLIKDIAVTFNAVVKAEESLKQYKKRGHEYLRGRQGEIAALVRQTATNRRLCLLSCFNLIEAYVNGLAWEFAQRNDITKLSKAKQKMITEAEGSIIKRIINIPEVITGAPSPFSENDEPLKGFIDTIKPFRDSIVHASPFAAPAKFGGYDKLEKIYELDTRTVRQAIDITESIISIIHRATVNQDGLPSWFIQRDTAGLFVIEVDR